MRLSTFFTVVASDCSIAFLAEFALRSGAFLHPEPEKRVAATAVIKAAFLTLLFHQCFGVFVVSEVLGFDNLDIT